MWRVLFVCLVLCLCSGARADERVLLHPQGAPGLGAPSATAGSIAALRALAEERGSLQVMVGLRVPFAAEGKLTAGEIRQQRAEIAAAASALRARFSAAVARQPGSFRIYESIPFLALEVAPDELERLAADPLVISIVENAMAEPMLRESTGMIRAGQAHGAGFTGAGQAIAIIDTGVDKNHPFLGNRVISEACYSVGRLCPGGVASSTAPGSAMPCSLPGCEHGTHVAGIAAGSGPDFSGVARGAGIIAIQVQSEVEGRPRAALSDILSGLERVYELRQSHAIAAVNLSLGFGLFGSVCDALSPAFAATAGNLRSAGIAIIASSGNDSARNGLSFPACMSGVVSVGAVWDGNPGSCRDGQPSLPGKVACFSNSAPFLSLLAPGSNITSSLPGNRYGAAAGTSMAAPHVAGAWAVLKQKVPAAGVDAILAAFQATGVPVTDDRNGIVKRRIDVKAALDRFAVLRVAKAGTGQGTVFLSPALSQSSCTASCAAEFILGTRVKIRPAAAPGSRFAGWSGACRGTRSCTIRMHSARWVTAIFNQVQVHGLTYTAAGTGSGAVSFSPGGSLGRCEGSCTNSYSQGTRVRLRATPALGSRFAGWSGACRRNRPCIVTMRSARSVTATFITAPVHALSYTRAGAGSGSVSFSPAGSASSCEESCSSSFTDRTVVRLRATPAPGSRFAGWSGACRGTRSCKITMNAARSVTATFTAARSANRSSGGR